MAKNGSSLSDRVSRSQWGTWRCVSGLAFGLVIALLVASAIWEIRRMDRINGRPARHHEPGVAETAAHWRGGDLLDRNNDITTARSSCLTDQEQIESLLQCERRNSKKISEAVGHSTAFAQSEEAKALLGSVVKEARQRYFEHYQRARHLLLDEKKHDAQWPLCAGKPLRVCSGITPPG